MVGASGQATTYRPDVQVRQPWTLKDPAAAEVASAPPATAATEPIRVLVEEEIERWLEIRDTTGRLITVLELLSPTNKRESDERDRYLRKCRGYITSGVNLVEIDLLRPGASIFPQAVRNVLQQAGACYGICVFRAALPVAREVYPIRLRDRLPVIGIPLRPTDADAVLDLQPLIDQCHERGRYHLLNYRIELEPPLAADDASWVAQLLREHEML